jgi:hypothetical protein
MVHNVAPSAISYLPNSDYSFCRHIFCGSDIKGRIEGFGALWGNEKIYQNVIYLSYPSRPLYGFLRLQPSGDPTVWLGGDDEKGNTNDMASGATPNDPILLIIPISAIRSPIPQ